MQNSSNHSKTVLVTGATGKTGRRVVARLAAAGRSVREGSRSASPAFHWDNEASWDACLRDIGAVYINYAPDLAIPGATDTIKAFVEKAVAAGVERLVLLSGRGEVEAQAAERIVQNSGVEWTIVRASWFNQNFSEGAFLDMVRAGQIALPAGDTPEPFIDVDDIADVVAAALTDAGHAGQVYEVTGSELLTMHDIARELSAATGRSIDYVEIPHEAFIAGAGEAGAPQDVLWLLDYLFSSVYDGRNASIADGVERALGRAPRRFADYAHSVAAAGLWNPATVTAATPRYNDGAQP